MKPSLKVGVSDKSRLYDKIGTNKWWFNGAKFFYTVKVLPARLNCDR